MLIRNLLAVLLVAMLGISSVSAEDAKPTMSMEGMSYPMQKSMDPNVWMQMMTMMMDPSKMSSMENCALCHEGDDLARYAKDFGPMMESMQSMTKSVAPHQMVSQMNPMMSSMGGMMNPMTMMNPMMGMMNPAMMMNMMYPAMGMMGPMMGMMGPMMNPMGMMGGMGGMNMMNPMGMMGGMNSMNPMGMMGGANNANPMGNMMNPEQYTDWFNQMMKSFTPQQPANN